MKVNRLVIGSVLVAILALSVSWVSRECAAGDDESARSSLKGLGGLGVVVEDMRAEVERDGLTRDQLQADVELRLRKAGIRVVKRDDVAATPGAPYLYVNLNALKDPDVALYVYALGLELTQRVTLVRDPKITVFAATWGVRGVGTIGVRRLGDLRSTVTDYVDRFINAYLEQNPR